MNIVAGAQFKDCESGDFEHYFIKTILLWNLTETKKRLFMCEGLIGGTVHGQYLTRQRELKPKTFSFKDWWKSLDVLPPYGKTFNLGTSVALWYPSMSRNLKKSYPLVTSVSADNPNNLAVQFLGNPQAGEITVQNIMACAFPRYYSMLSIPTLGEALDMESSAVAAQGDFAIDFKSRKVFLKNSSIGEVLKFPGVERKFLVKTPLSKEILVDLGHVHPDKVQVIP